MDAVSLLYAGGYGLFMGSYPVPIKTPAVLKAEVHPLIFQSFKSFWVFVTGFLALIPLAVENKPFQFSWWGVASAAAWVPSGLCTMLVVTIHQPQSSVGLSTGGTSCVIMDFVSLTSTLQACRHGWCGVR